MTIIYKTSLDTLAKIVTVSITILFSAIITGQVLLLKNEGIAISIIPIVILLLIYVGTFLFRPIDYCLTKDKLIIHRSFTNIEIERTEIKSVKQVEQEKLKWTFRTFGVGGFFGYWGRFTNSKIGSMTWYATRRNNAVLVETINNQKILLTPDQPEKFVLDFNL